jgi:hypothetical protein
MIMAVDAEQLPVAAIGGIIVVIDVLMVHRKFAQTFSVEFTPAAPADVGKQLERAGPVARLSGLGVTAKLGEKLSLSCRVWSGVLGLHGPFLLSNKAPIFHGAGQANFSPHANKTMELTL